MSKTFQVRISRDGNEIGSYPSDEVVRLRVNGILNETDFYWHEGMTDWAPLTQFLASEARRKLAEEALQRKQEEARRAERLAHERAKAKEEEDRAVAEAVRVRLEKEKAKAKEDEAAIAEATRVQWVKDKAKDRLDEYGGLFKFFGTAAFIIGVIVFLRGLAGDPDGSAIRQQVLVQTMTNGILLMILGYMMARR